MNCFLLLRFLATLYFAPVAAASTQDFDTQLVHAEQYTLGKLQAGDSLVLDYTTAGCFHRASYRLVIRREDDRFIASLERHYQNAGTPINTVRQETILTNASIQAFNQFEKELVAERPEGCTTVDTYKLQSGYGTISRTDGSCNWNGFTKLQLSLFAPTGL